MHSSFCRRLQRAARACRWVPELAELPTKHLRSPWEASAAELQRANVRIGDAADCTYPPRITTEPLPALRQRNVDAIRDARAARPDLIDAGGYDVLAVPPGAAKGVKGGRVRVFTVPGVRGKSRGEMGKVARGGGGGGAAGGRGGKSGAKKGGGRGTGKRTRQHGGASAGVAGVPPEAVPSGRR